jgi:hypothetical protein
MAGKLYMALWLPVMRPMCIALQTSYSALGSEINPSGPRPEMLLLFSLSSLLESGRCRSQAPFFPDPDPHGP